MNPVRLVATVVARKSNVQPSSLLPAISPNKTTNPDKIPTRLITTWTKVNGVIPRIMTCPFRGIVRDCVLAKLVRPERFELPTYSSGGCRSIQLSYGRAADSSSVHRSHGASQRLVAIPVET